MSCFTDWEVRVRELESDFKAKEREVVQEKQKYKTLLDKSQKQLSKAEDRAEKAEKEVISLKAELKTLKQQLNTHDATERKQANPKQPTKGNRQGSVSTLDLIDEKQKGSTKKRKAKEEDDNERLSAITVTNGNNLSTDTANSQLLQ